MMKLCGYTLYAGARGSPWGMSIRSTYGLHTHEMKAYWNKWFDGILWYTYLVRRHETTIQCICLSIWLWQQQTTLGWTHLTREVPDAMPGLYSVSTQKPAGLPLDTYCLMCCQLPYMPVSGTQHVYWIMCQLHSILPNNVSGCLI